jgi:SAM-dependent methyltransferase
MTEGESILKDKMDKIYREFSLEEIPWNLENPPDLLVDLIESHRVLPCDAVDLGCGAGNYAVWLATKGFQVTGVDISPKALELARQLAAENGVSCRFAAADLLGSMNSFQESFDFAYDWEVLHHVFPANRNRYVSNVARVLRTGACYLSVCFSEEDPAFGGKGKYRKTPLGTTLYFSSEQELRHLYEPWFEIEELCIAEIVGKYAPHLAVKALLTKKEQGNRMIGSCR